MTGITDFATQAGLKAPSFAGVSNVVIWVGLGIFGMIIIGGVLYWYMVMKSFNINIKLFKKINGRFTPVMDEKGKFERIGRAGDLWLVTQKLKKRLPRPKLPMTKNTYWYWEREDGEWINFQLSDFDKQMKEAKAYFIDEDMRLQRLGIYKNLENRFEKIGFWDKYGQMIITIIVILLFFVMKTVELNHEDKVVNGLKTVAENQDTTTSRLLSACGMNGNPNVPSGVVPAGGQQLT